MRRTLRLLSITRVAGVLAALAVLAADVAAAAPALSFADSTLRIAPGKTGDEVSVLVKAEGFPADKMPADSTARLEDIHALKPSGPAVKFATPPTVVAQGAGSRAWLWKADVTGLPLNSTQKRFARLVFGNVEQLAEYTVTNAAAGTFTWAVTGPGSPWVVYHGLSRTRAETALLVTTGEWPATNVRLAQSTLREGTLLSAIELADVDLCDGERCGPQTIAPRTTKTLTLKLKSASGPNPLTWLHGKYTGTLSLAADERTEPQALSLTVQATSWLARAIGVVLIALGVLLWWWANVWARGRLLRLEALKPVIALRQQIATLRERVAKGPAINDARPAKIDDALVKLSERLSTDQLDAANLLPVRHPFTGAADRSTALKDRLTAVSGSATALAVVIRDGLEKLWSEWLSADLGPPDSAIRSAWKAALHELDEKGARVEKEDEAKEIVKAALKTYNDAKPKKRDLDSAAPSAPDREPTTIQEVTWEIGRIQKWSWVLWMGVTVLTGVPTVIMANGGFGTAFDLLFCFFWGFGLPTSVEKLQQLTPTSLAASAGVTLPKVG